MIESYIGRKLEESCNVKETPIGIYAPATKCNGLKKIAKRRGKIGRRGDGKNPADC